jgi:ferrochelatase
VLLVAFGGPTRPEEVRPFLEQVARGRSIPPERLEEVARHYARLPGGCSPLRELTEAQARALAAELRRVGVDVPVFVGMRNGHPSLDEALSAMAARGCRRALAIILSPMRTEASWDRYMLGVTEARARLPGSLEVRFAPPWGHHDGFIAAVADRARRALDEVPTVERGAAALLFTAHSVPAAMADASPYVDDFTTASDRVARALGHVRWRLAYQSRSGRASEPWLEPDIGDLLKEVARDGARHAVVVPIGFVADHVEVLYDLDVEARATAEALGLGWHRAAAVNDHPAFVTALADLVRAAAR